MTRAHDDFLTREAATAGSLAADGRSAAGQLRQLETVFPTGEQGVGYAARQFLNALVDLASAAGRRGRRARWCWRAPATWPTASPRPAASSMCCSAACSEDLKADVAADQPAGAQHRRAEPAHRRGAGPRPRAERPARPARPGRSPSSARTLQVTTVEADDGSLAVFIGGGQRLVLGAQVQPLTVEVDPCDAVARRARPVAESGFVRMPAAAGTGRRLGRRAAALPERATWSMRARQLGQMAAALAGKVNEQQALGLDLRDPPGSGAPIFAVGAARGRARRRQRASTAPASSSARSA